MEETRIKLEPEESRKAPHKRKKRRGPRLTGVSRQRRLANARERNRVQIINASIDRLRGLIPLFPDEKKPTKMETIRLAALYISCLTELLQTSEKADEVVFDDLHFPLPTYTFNFDVDPFFDDEDLRDFFWDNY